MNVPFVDRNPESTGPKPTADLESGYERRNDIARRCPDMRAHRKRCRPGRTGQMRDRSDMRVVEIEAMRHGSVNQRCGRRRRFSIEQDGRFTAAFQPLTTRLTDLMASSLAAPMATPNQSTRQNRAASSTSLGNFSKDGIGDEVGDGIGVGHVLK